LELIQSGEYFFLSRPRRFGKSLFLSTLKAIFEGKKEYFEGLYIYDKWDWEERYPVIHISFGGGVLKTREDILDKIDEVLQKNRDYLQIDCPEDLSYRRCFALLISETYKKYNKKVVILVDEYDKPILDNIENIEMARLAREELKNIYSVIKDSDQYIKFVFLTGVSKFSKTSIFSGLNNLYDITLDENYGNICGYTQEELEREFAEWLVGVDLQELKDWYNGYNFLADKIYNPFDILLFLKNNKTFKNYWFETGTPTFLMKLIEKNRYFLPKLSNLIVSEKLISSFDIDNLDIEVILYQAGYLTIRDVYRKSRGIDYLIGFPNKEVKISFNEFIIDKLLECTDGDSYSYFDKFDNSLNSGDMESFRLDVISLFSSIPYNNYVNNELYKSEGFYATVLYAYLQGLGVDIIGEDVTNRGRIDLTVKFPNAIYIMEIKVTDEDPLEQIKLKRYYEKYLNEGKDIYLVGMKFDRTERNLKEFVWEKL
ncbi:MAG: ATP-binding protein, partial [Candidatus Omnitrophica bacterium]|nr:ATP-binding protein [Candidatus Omnitrophota bacterium]